MRRLALVLPLVLSACIASITAGALWANATWNGATGDWAVDTNWDTGSAPTAADQVFISSGTVEVTSTESSLSMYIAAGGGFSGALQVLAGGDLNTRHLYIGINPGANGVVGVSGGGRLDQRGGSQLTVGIANATGTLSVDGPASIIDWTGGIVELGLDSTGLMLLTNGGTFAATSATLGVDAGAVGEIRIGNGGAAGVLATPITAGDGTARLLFDHTDDVTYGFAVSGAVAVTKAGSGTLELTGTNTHTGGTTLQAGTLVVNGTQSGSGVILQGGTLNGTGTLGDLSATGGTIAPGLSAGHLTVALASFDASTTFAVELDGDTAGTEYDQLTVTAGSVTLGNATLTGTAAVAHPVGTTFVIIDKQSGGAVSGTFDGLPQWSVVTIAGQQFVISYVGGDGNDVTLTASGATAVAPGTLPDMAVGEPFSVTFTATGGVAPYTFSVSTGTLPAGLSLEASTGVLSGTPTTPGAFSFSITATDSLAVTDVQAYTGTIPAAVPGLPMMGSILLALLLAGVGYARLRA